LVAPQRGRFLATTAAFFKYNSGGKYELGEVKAYGLVARRDNPFAATSPDGVAALRVKREGDSEHAFSCLVALEVKTSATENTEAALELSSSANGFVEVDAGSDEFAQHVKKPSYRSQVVHHAVVLGLSATLVIFGTRNCVKKVVLMHISQEQAQDWLKMLAFFNHEYMEDVLRSGTLPRIAPDGSRAYGYAVEHHTVELYLGLWKAHNDDVVVHGTPPPSVRILPLMASTWNKFMGGVDTVRQVLSGHASKYGSMRPSSLVWMVFFNYMFYNAFRTYQLCHMDVGPISTYAQFASIRKRVCTYGEFLFRLGLDISTPELLKRRPEFARVHRVASPIFEGDEVDPPVSRASDSGHAATTAPTATAAKNKVIFHANSSQELAERRLSGGHVQTIHPPEAVNYSCVLCCMLCKKGNQAHTTRRGSLSRRHCMTCTVTLCTKPGYSDSCWSLWHSKNRLKFPDCMRVPYTSTLRFPRTELQHVLMHRDVTLIKHQEQHRHLVAGQRRGCT
jgi:hypothetical protein